MDWKKWILMLAVVLLTGCADAKSSAEEAFSVSLAQREAYEQKIAETMDSFYWKYDANSILYSEESIPDRSDENNAILFEASMDAGFDLQKFAGKTAVVATVNLIHFNEDSAGVAYFYFIKEKLVGLYYRSENTPDKAYSLKSRNIFSQPVEFAAYETDENLADFSESRSAFPVEGFCSFGEDERGRRLLAAIEGSQVSVYRYEDGMKLVRTIPFGSRNENMPMSAAFFRMEGQEGDRLAILLGSYIYTESSHDLEGYYISTKVAFLDESMQKTNEEFTLGETDYSCVASEDGRLIMVNGAVLEYMAKEGETWIKEAEYPLENGVAAFLAIDLDQDGEKEYLMMDGMDFFVYKKDEIGFYSIWKTHLSIESLMGSIYAGDLNQDGVKEIYVSDKTGTMIRYILTENGLISRNEDIEYGQRFYVCDFNKDGKDDYIKIEDAENNSQKLYLAN